MGMGKTGVGEMGVGKTGKNHWSRPVCTKKKTTTTTTKKNNKKQQQKNISKNNLIHWILNIFFRKTDQKQLNIILQFPANYPDDTIVTELTSKTMSEKLLAGLIKMCDEEAKKKVGQKQVHPNLFITLLLGSKPISVLPIQILFNITRVKCTEI